MLWIAAGLKGYGIEATDGSIGGVSDLLFEDEGWTVRWLVIDTGTWLPGRKVLLPPDRLGRVDAGRQQIATGLSRRQVEDSPDVDTDRPVSRQMEADIYDHYGWDPYWSATPGFAPPLSPSRTTPPAAAMTPPPAGAGPAAGVATERSVGRAEGDPHLRSAGEVTGYAIQATDGAIGHVEDFLVEDDAWVIRYVVIDTRDWWPGKKVLLSPDWAERIDWSEGALRVALTRTQVRDAPEYDPVVSVDRNYEEKLYRYYDRVPYWTSSTP